MIEGREQDFFDFLLDGMEGVASMTNAGWGRGKVEDIFQSLVLKIDVGDALEGGIGFEVEFQGKMEVGGIEEGVEHITTMFFKRSFTEAVGIDGNING